MIQVKEMMQDNDLKNSKSKDKGSRSRSQSMNEQSHYKQDKTKTRQSINVKSHIFNVRGDNDKTKQTPTRMLSVVLKLNIKISSKRFLYPHDSWTKKPENQWTRDERKAAKLKITTHSLILSVLPRPMNSVLNYSPDNEEDTRISQEYLNDLEEEYQARALLAKSKRFFKKGTQRFSSTKATDQTECHKCGKKGHFARDCWSKTSVSTYHSPFQSKPFISPQHKPELRPTKDFEAKYNKVKAKLALLSSSASASKAPIVKNKGLIIKAYEWDKEEVSSDDNEIVEVKVLMELAKEK
ncbi:retrovirus-related pol polyprotein from transposon TNT 1-94 [Tanacetum coccineum]